MNCLLEKIKKECKHILTNYKVINKINTGFTNDLYAVDNKFIIKVCSNKENEEQFTNEINFYLKHSNNPYIPKLYLYHIKESSSDFSYEIIEKINGKSLYYLWHTFSNEKRETVIKEITNIMKSFHHIKGNSYDWSNYIISKISKNLEKIHDLKLFDDIQYNKAKTIILELHDYLICDDLRLVHSDIHFDNIILNENNELKIIDFETILSAPIDYELDIFLRMCKNPFKYSSEETEKLIKLEDYDDIENQLKKYYPEIFKGDHFDMRHSIYDLEANLRLLSKFPRDEQLKIIILNGFEKTEKMLK